MKQIRLAVIQFLIAAPITVLLLWVLKVKQIWMGGVIGMAVGLLVGLILVCLSRRKNAHL